MGIKVLGTGSYLPEIRVENEAFTSIVETSDEWIVKHSGIRARRFHDGATFEMAIEAANSALENAGVSAEEIDLILCTTVTSDYDTPALACVVQGRIGAVNAAAFDVNAACAGFVFGLDVASMYLERGYRKILLISAEALSKVTDFSDRSTCVLFGDGAGAVVLEHAEKPFYSALHTDGTGAYTLFARKRENEVPFVKERRSVQQVDGYSDCKTGMLYMDGPKVYKFAVTVMPKVLRETCEKAGITPAELDWIVPHQANLRIIQTAVTALKFPMERVICNIEECANTSSACIPIALDQAVRDGRIKRGQKICLVGFGGGLVYAGAIFEF